ncbi:TetR/AcrR family transcriptional regulator [Nonomuraea longicatena]|uniref:TetR/AcrR family transcriptional regulator n=1 Tax=Nonomuraea longicatena TaxID=83682 RepID=A0ABN1PW79_9ACTN
MATQDDPDHSVELLWRGVEEQERKGLSLQAIVRAAVEIADADGLDGVSMRRVSERLGFTTMSLYRHVPGKAQLIELMCDLVMAEVTTGRPPETADAEGRRSDWRERLERWARQGWALAGRHPWLAEVRGTRHVPGPHSIADFDHALGAVAGTGLRPAEMVAVVGLVGRFVDSEAAGAAERARVERQTSQSEEDWWGARQSLFDRLDRYPVLTAVWESGGYDDPEDSFEFGLARVLDGIEVLIKDRNEKRDETRVCETCGTLLDPTGPGRPRAYCSQACRQRAYRERHTTSRSADTPEEQAVTGSVRRRLGTERP